MAVSLAQSCQMTENKNETAPPAFIEQSGNFLFL
jgi:hypothetical protein